MDELTALRITVAEDQEVIESYKQRAEQAEAELADLRTKHEALVPRAEACEVAFNTALELLGEALEYCIPTTRTHEDIEAFLEAHRSG